MNEVTVHKLDENGALVWQYAAVIKNREDASVRLEAFFDHDDIDLGLAILKRGDRFIETFYNDRWYNVFAVYDRDNQQLKGWYCNICRPAELGETVIRCEDLALDMWITPPDRIHILDKEEFDSMLLGSEERSNCLLAQQELERLARSHQLPC